MVLLNEEWKPVPEYGGRYLVSNRGRIKSVKRIVMGRNNYNRSVPERMLKARTHRDGHLEVTLYKNGNKKYHYVHRLVLGAFIGSCPDNMESLHRNGDPSDNRVENLLYGTHAENMRMANCKNG